jgi:hypothetical protein
MKERRIVRFIWFGITIIIGLVLGLLAGWSKSIKTSEASFSSLRQDYQIDIVLMVAEIYRGDEDLSAAEKRLAYLEADDIVLFVQQAVRDAETIGYAKSDIKMMNTLADDLEADLGIGSGDS